MFDTDRFYMSQALMLAKRGELTVSPNPMVGCVIVKNSRIIGESFHQYKGGHHAEIEALSVASTEAKDATVYVTLEPCCYTGSTPPCTNALITAEVKKVVIATTDPNPKVSGNGIKVLQSHGIAVTLGVLEQEARTLNKIFFHYHTTKRPYVLAKWGMSLDGEIKVAIGDTKAITNTITNIQTHNLRNRFDAIMVGAKTIIADNPVLTVRFSEASKINQPLRVIISTSADLPGDLQVFNTEKAPTVLFTTNKANTQHLEKLKQQEVECIIVSTNQHNEISMSAVLDVLAQKGITSVLVEGGKQLHRSFFKEHLINEVHSFIAPVIINGYPKKYYISRFDYWPIQENILLLADLKNSKSYTSERQEISYV